MPSEKLGTTWIRCSGLNSCPQFFYKDGYHIKSSKKGDMPLKEKRNTVAI